ncbi:hypothetical protein LTR56_025371 [Elasticomyces elasticus]|nr:hypothetical protein LTR56_025371 [Elasticomyces elasticus]KAK3620934.1 hypothetical protein LTR22_025412 [Elasticomyces elasticus]KAK4917572.1 hypothetical protein LTR49_014526 [Elasticomyces elasticus]KAK5762792.1 hypothetical protein LTS12_006981 [Elasticomyces elasticus]
MADELRDEDADSANIQQVVVTPTAEGRTDGTATSGLFGLPPELRINIYELVLLRDSLVDAQWREPALLSVSRRVRDEASSVYYKGNQFNHDIMDCNADLMHKWVLHVYGLGFDRLKIDMLVVGQPNWTNLLQWCRELCECKAGVCLKCANGRDELDSVVEAATQIAVQFCDADRSWEECKPVLEALRLTVGTFEPRWLV